MMEQHGQLARYCDDGLNLGLLPASGGQMQTLLSQCRVSSVRSKDMVGTLDQQASEI